MNKDLRQNELVRTGTALRALWRNWALSVGAMTAPMLAAIFLPRIWVPFVCLAAAYLLSVVIRHADSIVGGRCSLLMNMSRNVLYVSAAIMFLVVVLCTDWLVPTVIRLWMYNSELPFVTCLVMFPVAAAMCGITLFLGIGSATCRECQRRHGYYAGDSLVATIYYRESKYQIWLILVLSLMLGAVQYWYYFARYINYNVSDPDRFFFNIMPLAVYLLSLVVMGGRYRSMRGIYDTIEGSNPAVSGVTQLRFLIFCGDDLVLRRGGNGRWDTPAVEIIGRTPAVGETQARLSFRALTGIERFTLRYCYTNEGFAPGTNVIHFAAFIEPDSKESFRPDDLWFNAYMLDRGLATNSLAPQLANELYRIHTMTMAWKTYDRNGRRLYPIKHYRPTFRFGDLAGWAVDYDDMAWFDVAANNEDSHFFRVNRLWNRMTGFMRRNKATAK